MFYCIVLSYSTSTPRWAISLATMPQIMGPCSTNLQDVMGERLERCLMFESGIFGMYFLVCQYYMTFIVHSCLAHIINLATQALISTRSKAKYYAPDTDDAHIPDLG